jgi:hypothetical protein
MLWVHPHGIMYEHLFLWLNNIPCGHSSFCLSDSPVDGHLLLLPFSFVKSAAINTQYRYLFGHPISSSSGHMSSSGIPESCGNSVFNFLRTWQNVFHRGHPILHSHILLFATSVILHYFLYGQSGECDLVSMSLTWFYGWHWASFHEIRGFDSRKSQAQSWGLSLVIYVVLEK